VIEAIMQRLPVTLELTILAMIISMIVAIRRVSSRPRGATRRLI